MPPKHHVLSPTTISPLFRDVRAVLESARASTHRTINVAMLRAYWEIGKLIIEHEQKGQKRAAYGETVLEDLGQRLTAEFGRGFDVTNLRKMRQFYHMFQIRDAMRLESGGSPLRCLFSAPKLSRSENEFPSPLGRRCREAADEGHAVLSSENPIPHPALSQEERENHFGGLKRLPLRGGSLAVEMERARPTVSDQLSWSHYRLLMQVENPKAREWYMREAIGQRWSTRQLERQISVLYYERLLASRKKTPVRVEAKQKLAALGPEHFIRDPYVLDFLNLNGLTAWRESALEQAIITNLQSFLLELGKGFSFVARQKRMRFEEEDFYVDLVFYNYLLKCFVLVDLKVGKLTHQDVGQMEAYVRMFDAQDRPPKDNPTIGLILCSSKNEAIAKYSVLNDRRQIFAAKYVKVLPTERELRREIERERYLIDTRSI